MKIEKINQWFKKMAEMIVRHRITFLVAFLLLLAFGFAGTKHIYFQTSWDSYFVEDDPMLLKTDEFKSIFGNDYYVAVLVKNEKGLFTKENLELIRELSNELRDSISYAEKITSLTDLEFMVGNEEGMAIEQIVPEVIPSDVAGLDSIRTKAYSKPNTAKKLISKDGTMSWIMLKLRPFPEDSVWKAEKLPAPDLLTGQETERIINKEKYASIHPNASGMPYMTYCKTNYISKEMSSMMMIAVIVCFVVMVFVTRSLRGVLIPILTSASSIVIAFGIVGWLGLYVDQATTMIAILLTFAIAIAYNIHLYNFFRTRLIQTNDRKQAVIDAIAETGWPIFFSGFTTLAAMMTFLTMNIVPMKAMGVISAICILSALISCIIITPIVLSFGRNRKKSKAYNHSFEGKAGNAFDRFGGWVLKNHKPIMVIAIIITIVSGIGVYKIEPAFDVERTMGRKVEYVNRFLDLCETELGSMYSYDVMVVLPNNDDAKNPENLKKLEQLATIAEGYELTKRHNSVLDIIKDMNCTLNSNLPEYYTIPENPEMVAQLLLLYENAGGTESEYWMDYDYRRLRLQIELKSFNSREAEYEMMDIQEKAKELYPDAEVSAVGNLPQFAVMQQYIEIGQMKSMLWSVLIIGVLLMLVFGNWRLGLIGMIPNLAPAIFVGGLMGWMEFPLDMMTACIIPMILGIAVDDTIHFINHGHLEFDRQKNYTHAVRKTFHVVGLAIVMSTVIISAVFSGFISCSALQFKNFGVLAVAGMLSALAADLFITPILFKYFKVFGKEKVNEKENNK